MKGMASQSHATTVARDDPDGVTRAYKWHEDGFPSEAVLALIDDLKQCKAFAETNSKITMRNACINNNKHCMLESRNTTMSADIMRVFAYHNVALQMWHRHPEINYIEYRVGFPVE